MDNSGGVPQATADQHEIELMKQLLLPSMSKDIEAAPKWSHELRGESNCSIFRVPQALAEGVAKACRPHIVSIGPYHHGESQLQMLQRLKWSYLHTMLDRTKTHGIHLENLIDVVAPKEKMIRQCYSENIDNFNGSDLVKIMVLDGCFIIELLRQPQRYEPPLDMLTLASVRQDLLRLENQVPYFVLNDLFATTKLPGETLSLAYYVSHFFSFFLEGDGWEKKINPEGVHLLDLFRLSIIPPDQQDIYPADESQIHDMIRSASELRRVGIRFEQRVASTVLDVKFERKSRTIGIPQMEKYDDDLLWILPNMVVFEQCSGQIDGHATVYAIFMGSLIRTANDVQLLCDHKVITNFGMSNEDLARFFRDVCKDATFDFQSSYLKSHVATLNKSLRYEWAYLCRAQLLNAFHDNPWSALSGLAVLVTLTGIIQTVYTVLQYYRK